MEWYAWLFIGIIVVLFATVYVLDEIEYCKRINELAKEGKVVWIIRL